MSDLPCGLWRHYKGDIYQLLGVACDNEGDLRVFYMSFDLTRPGPRLRHRPLHEWSQLVKVDSCSFVSRYTYIGIEMP